VDGCPYFEPDGKTTEKAVVSVKGGGHVAVSMIRDLLAAVDREGAKMEVFLTLEDLFAGKKPHMPWIDPSVFKKAKRERTERQGDLEL
jgi:site-specific DNA-methyltransferase (adenine-specific)